jgi:hypothetical protein
MENSQISLFGGKVGNSRRMGGNGVRVVRVTVGNFAIFAQSNGLALALASALRKVGITGRAVGIVGWMIGIHGKGYWQWLAECQRDFRIFQVRTFFEGNFAP